MTLLLIYLGTILWYALAVYLSRFVIYRINVEYGDILISNRVLAILGFVPFINIQISIWFLVLNFILTDEELKEIIKKVKENEKNS